MSLGNSIVWSGGYDHYHHSHDEIYSRDITSEKSGGPWKLVAKMKTRRAFHCSVAYRKNSVVIIGRDIFPRIVLHKPELRDRGSLNEGI